MNRRQFLRAAGAASTFAAAACADSPATDPRLTVVDCHTHFFDPERPVGVPWPGQTSPLFRPTYVADYRRQSVPAEVAATVVVEASPWLEDNQWVLDLASQDPFIIGLCGNLDPLDEAFSVRLARFAANPLFRGIRLGGGVVASHLTDGAFVANLARLVEHRLQLDINGPPGTLGAVSELASRMPELPIVIDHLANISIDGRTIDPDWRLDIEAAAAHPGVFAKISGLVEAGARAAGTAPLVTEFYARHLDVLWNAFGEDRLVYGSNWPVSGLYAPLHDVQRMVHEYFGARGNGPLRKVFAGNARAVYGVGSAASTYR